MAVTRKKRSRDWLLTWRQTIPRLRSVLRQLRPTYHLDDVRQITPEFLARQGIRGILWDVDGTLTTYHAMAVADEFRQHIADLFANTALHHAIVSNCDERRFDELKTIFPTVPLIRAYRASDDTVPRTALGTTDTHSPPDVEQLLAAGAEQIRKPSRDLIDHAVAVLDIPPEHCVMVGDQYFTDVASANLAGIRSVKVRTYGKTTFPRTIQTTQKLEVLVYRLLHGDPRHSTR